MSELDMWEVIVLNQFRDINSLDCNKGSGRKMSAHDENTIECDIQFMTFFAKSALIKG